MDAGVQVCSYNPGGDPGPPHLWTPVVTWIHSPAMPHSSALGLDGTILSDWAAQVPAFIVRLNQTGRGDRNIFPPQLPPQSPES